MLKARKVENSLTVDKSSAATEMHRTQNSVWHRLMSPPSKWMDKEAEHVSSEYLLRRKEESRGQVLVFKCTWLIESMNTTRKADRSGESSCVFESLQTCPFQCLWVPPVIPGKVDRITTCVAVSHDLFLPRWREHSLEFLVRFSMLTFFDILSLPSH